jgi:hypothetical protein
MSNGETEARCKSCDRPVMQIPGRRKREYCNATCRQRHHRKQGVPHASVGEEQATHSATQEQLAAPQEENIVLRTTMQTLLNFLEKLRNVKEMARSDTQARPWKRVAEAGARVCRNPVWPALSGEERGHVAAWLPWHVPGCDEACGLRGRGEGAVPGGLGSDALAGTVQG